MFKGIIKKRRRRAVELKLLIRLWSFIYLVSLLECDSVTQACFSELKTSHVKVFSYNLCVKYHLNLRYYSTTKQSLVICYVLTRFSNSSCFEMDHQFFQRINISNISYNEYNMTQSRQNKNPNLLARYSY